MGGMSNEQTFAALQSTFKRSCEGQRICSMELEYSEVFTDECVKEIERRNDGLTDKGPAKAFAIAQCSIPSVRVLD